MKMLPTKSNKNDDGVGSPHSQWESPSSTLQEFRRRRQQPNSSPQFEQDFDNNELQEEKKESDTQTLLTPTETTSSNETSFFSPYRRKKRRKRWKEISKRLFYVKIVIKFIMFSYFIKGSQLFNDLYTFLDIRIQQYLNYPQIVNHEFYQQSFDVDNNNDNDMIISTHDWNRSFIHIVHSRFMQNQPQLKVLGWARWYLFLAFCYPTMVEQSIQDYFWIIQTDPMLWYYQPDLFYEMQTKLQPHDNIYLVASNMNFLVPNERNNTQQQQQLDESIHQASWKNGKQGIEILYNSPVYTGNITKLRQAMALRNDLVVLETRLDADDGLHIFYLEYIQYSARKRFLNDTVVAPQWLYWCSRRVLEWHSDTTIPSSRPGTITPIQHDKLCITPGITVGYGIDVDPDTVPIYPHDELYHALQPSNNDNNNNDQKPSFVCPNPPCLELVQDLLFCALRSRTITSAGMLKVNEINNLFSKNQTKQQDLDDKLWQLCELRFAMNLSMVETTHLFLQDHQAEIALDNYNGQCTFGHSCKESAKLQLESYFSNSSITTTTLNQQPHNNMFSPSSMFLRARSKVTKE